MMTYGSTTRKCTQSTWSSTSSSSNLRASSEGHGEMESHAQQQQQQQQQGQLRKHEWDSLLPTFAQERLTSVTHAGEPTPTPPHLPPPPVDEHDSLELLEKLQRQQRQRQDGDAAVSGELVQVRESIVSDACDTIKLGVPIFVAMLSWVGMKTTDTALLGHASAEALSAAALSDLWTMCTGVLFQGRVLGILCGQAVGAGNPKLAGVYLQVSYLVLGIVSVFVFIAWNFTDLVWIAFGESERVSADAGYYARVLSWSIPGQVAFSQLSQFFSSQRIMHPEVMASSIGLGLNLVLGLTLVLGLAVPNFSGYGFAACPVVTTLVEYVQILFFWFVYCYMQGLHRPCWGGWSRKEITLERIGTFSALYFPAALGLASDFWRMGIVGAIAAKLGEEEVGVFNTSYRMMWMVLILVGALASAAGIKMSMKLGAGDWRGARQAGLVGVSLSLGILIVVSWALIGKIRVFGMIFTTDEVFLNMFEECVLPFVATLFLMNLSVAIEKIPISMGRTTEVFWMGFVASWFGQVPGVFLLTRYWRDDLVGLYTGTAIGYLILVVLYSLITARSDWKKYSDIAIQRSEMKK